MTDIPDPNRPETSPSRPSDTEPIWSRPSEAPVGSSYTPYTPPLPSTPLPLEEAPPSRPGPLGLGWIWWIMGGCAVLLLCCLCTMLLAALLFVTNSRSTIPSSPLATPRVVPVGTPRPSMSEDAPAVPVAPAPAEGSVPSSGPTGTKALDFELKTLDGQKVRLSEFRGRPVIVNFWATWCGPCLAEMPLLTKTYEELKDTGLVLIAVDVQESPATVQRYMDKNKLPFTVVLDETGLVASYYRVAAYPTTYFIDKDGIIQSWQRGTLTKTTMERHLDRIR